MAEPVNLVIDTDGGIDDAGALLLALSQPADRVRILAVTTVRGNCDVRQSAANVRRILKLCGKEESIPVFDGATGPIVPNPELEQHRATFYHGHDGFGDAPDAKPAFQEAPPKEEHAVSALIRLAKDVGRLTIVCIGPLTNVALALKLCPELGRRVSQCVVMGGNVHGTGNVHGASSAEFNFFGDPEAAHIVLQQLNAPITAVPWETYLKAAKMHDVDQLTISPRTDAFLHVSGSGKSAFMEAISRKGRVWCKERSFSYGYCDEMAMAVALTPDIVKSREAVVGSVELSGRRTRGQVVIDWMNEDSAPPNLTFVTDLDMNALAQMMLDAV